MIAKLPVDPKFILNHNFMLVKFQGVNSSEIDKILYIFTIKGNTLKKKECTCIHFFILFGDINSLF